MNVIALRHISGTADACPFEEGMIRLRLRTAANDCIRVEVLYACNKFDWWTTRQTAAMEKGLTDTDFDYYFAAIPLTDTRFAYVFRLTDAAGGVFYLSEEGVASLYDHDLAYFTYFQYTSMYDCDLQRVPQWTRTVTAYQIFLERFFAGDTALDRGYVNLPWGAKPHPKSFAGGDLLGVEKKLPYLAELGVGLLYLTPVFSSPSNHKYDVTDYERVDPAFGGNDALRSLINAAHARGMRVMLDGVFNHCSSSHPFFLDVCQKGRDSRYYDWFFIDGDKPDVTLGNYRMFGSVPYMPKLNTANPVVVDYFCRIAAMWTKDWGVDGWRLDVSDELSHRFLRAFRDRVLSIRADAIIIGEDWHEAMKWLNGDEYDGVMNYGFTKACLDLFAFGTICPAAFRDRLIRLYTRYSEATSLKLLNLLNSHDTERFRTRVGGDAAKHRAALALMFFYPGIPCVYYGDEIGLEGGYDPDCRRCFPWDETCWDAETRTLIRRLIALRRGRALSYGSFSVEEHDGVLTLSRVADGDRAVLIVNAAPEKRIVQTDTGTVELAPYGFSIQA